MSLDILLFFAHIFMAIVLGLVWFAFGFEAMVFIGLVLAVAQTTIKYK